MPMPGVATREAKRSQDTGCQLYEPEGINTCITGPAGCIALALIFLRTNSEAVASRVAIPQNLFQLEHLRPDFALLRILAQNLILWDRIEPTEEWLQRQTPGFLFNLDTSNADVDWLLVGQTKASLTAGACLALGLRFAGSSNKAAKQLLIARLLEFRDLPRSEAHFALMASKPTPDMDLDRITLETCQSAVAFALGMVMAGTGDLAALRLLRSLRKKAGSDTGYGVHMATHMAIGWLCLGAGRYTFDQEPLSIAALLMAAFPRLPIALVDNRCHLQAFRHLYAIAARHRCIEAIEVDSKQPVRVHVTLEYESKEMETVLFPRLLLPANVVSLRLCSEGYWPVTIRNAGTARWMKALQETRRLYVKRSGEASGSHAGESQAWFPSFTAPNLQQLERLVKAKARPLPPWQGPTEPGAVSSAEWAAAFCCEAPPPLPPGTCLSDFEEDCTLVERFAQLLGRPGAKNAQSLRMQLPFSALLAQKLHECVTESKLAIFPWFVLLHLQTKHVQDCSVGLVYTPVSACFSSLAYDQLLAALGFQEIRDSIGARHAPLLSEDFLVERKAELKQHLAGH
ncbi:unnamed protein product [Effrenium voratum]|nr:unnamed protein product [Effrenium voratum]